MNETTKRIGVLVMGLLVSILGGAAELTYLPNQEEYKVLAGDGSTASNPCSPNTFKHVEKDGLDRPAAVCASWSPIEGAVLVLTIIFGAALIVAALIRWD